MIILVDLDSVSFSPLETNRKLFESEHIFIHVFSFAFECMSLGRFCAVPEFQLPYHRRVSGGGVVFHGPRRDISFAFSFYAHSINLRDTFLFISQMISEFIKSGFGFSSYIRGTDVYFNNHKICGFAAARRRNFFVIEGCISLQFNDSKKNNIKNPQNFCFLNFGEEIENFHEISFNLIKFMMKNLREFI
ncbi:MAG: hypothetical protein NZ927_05450 [Candidatus Calescibacterium sp.]|nr:hypothetical protein [Candidatus Calescibacterium sp.]MCX7733186.1 hypothetical protein [bacterium]MDW8086894.1 hypothetical protein [Candidatus Calescibacterium sp.]